MFFSETTQCIDYSAIGATNILPLDIKDAVVKEKLSVLLFAEYFAKETPKPVLKYSELDHLSEIMTMNGNRELYFTVKQGDKQYSLSLLNARCFDFYEVMTPKAKFGQIYADDPVCKIIKPGASFEEISVYDAVRGYVDYSDSLRMEELSNLFHISCDTYSPFKLGAAFSPQQFPDTLPASPNTNIEGFGHFQRSLELWFKSGFPRCYSRYKLNNFGTHPNYPQWMHQLEGMQINMLPQPIFYEPLGPMTYDIRIDNSLREIRFYRLFLNSDGCGLREALLPIVFIQENGNLHTIMTNLPNMELLPFWNNIQIKSSDIDTVVLCGCIQDAEALQRVNKNVKNVAFTSYVGDHLEQVDFSPLAKKNIVFLISNHNGRCLEDAYEAAAKLFEFIKESKILIKDCVFQQREIEYPDNSLSIASPEKLASAYYHKRPRIIPRSLLPPMDENEFFTMLAKIRKEREAPPFWLPAEQPPVKKNPAEGILIRSLLYRNAITVLAGPPSAGKSRFCRSLIRYLVNGNDRQYMKERFWTRCCAKSTMKILYWNFDCIPDLESWKEICLRGLSEKQKEDIFIEDAPTEDDFFDRIYGRPDLGAYRRKLENYKFKGTSGHPLDLLIVDTLVSVWNKKNIEGSLHFLNQLMKAVPGMAVLAIHHTTELGKPLGGGDPKRMPRIVMTMERINQTVNLDSSGKQSAKKKNGEKRTVTSFYKIRYDKFSTSHADVEELPFYCVREDEDMYSVYKPVCTRDEMFGSLVYHYRENDDTHPSNKVIGAMLGYSNREVQKRVIDEKKYFAILKKALGSIHFQSEMNQPA